jgi:hypothetical protein
MNTHLIAALAQERTADMERRAERNRLLRSGARRRARRPAPSVTIREATAEDAAELRRLAQLDSSDEPGGPLLVAEVGDRLWSATRWETGSGRPSPCATAP